MEVKIKVRELNERLRKLVDNTYQFLEQTSNVELKNKLASELHALEDRVDLKVAFVGQYSSGKSTIISALTGNKDIEIDANVATDTVSEYRWKNIVLMDTPGILAGKVENHDIATNKALSECDLIVYVITSQLFDDVVFENFIDLAYKQRFKDKMLIAVNKMSMEAGDFSELEKNYLNSLENIFNERGYEFDHEIVFIDAADYIEGTQEQDDDFVKLSNFSSFISTLNSFVERKGILKKQYDTPVRLLKDAISEVVLTQTDPTLQQLLRQGINRIKAAQKGILVDLDLTIGSLRQAIINKGFEIGNMVGAVEEYQFRKQEEEFNAFVQKEIVETSKRIEKIIQEEESELMGELKEFSEKDSLKNYVKSIDAKLKGEFVPPQVEVNLTKQKQALDWLSQGSKDVLNASVKNSALNGLKAVSGSEVHKAVYSVGKFFGHNFKPWEAVKMAGNIGKVAKFAGPALGILSLGLDYHSNEKEEKSRKKIEEAKNIFFNSIVEFADSISRSIRVALDDYISNSYGQKIADLDNQIIEIVNSDSVNSNLSAAMRKLDSQYIEFIEVLEKE